MTLAKLGPGPKPQRPLWHYILPGLFVGALFVSLWLRQPVQYGQLKLQGQTMGTQWSATLIVPLDEVRRTPYNTVIQNALDDVNQKMSTWSPRSELSLFNASRTTAPQPISEETLQVLTAAQSVFEDSGGAFDVTIGPLVKAWGFGVGESESPPSEEIIAQHLHHIGTNLLTIDMPTLTAAKESSELEIDLSAIAKGFGVDQVHQALVDQGLTSFMVEVGGEIRTLGTNARSIMGNWIEQPDAPNTL